MYQTKLNKIGNLIESIKNDLNLPIVSDFLEWFYRKLEIHFIKKSPDIFMNIGDIFEVELGTNIGSELNKKRPCVVVSQLKYNKGNTVIVVPLRSMKETTRLGSVTFEVDVRGTGLKKSSYVTPINIREVSKKRLLNKIGRLNVSDIKRLKSVFFGYLRYGKTSIGIEVFRSQS